MSEKIHNIDLNISPYGPRNNGVPTPVMGAERSWLDKNGNVLATGAMVKLRHGYVHVSSNGGVVRIPVARLSDADSCGSRSCLGNPRDLHAWQQSLSASKLVPTNIYLEGVGSLSQAFVL